MATKIPVRSRSRKRLLNLGANRGAQGNLEALRDFNQTSTAAVLEATYVDPAPGRAEQIVERALKLGILANATEARAEEVIGNEEADAAIFHVDNAVTLADSMSALSKRRLPSLGYLIMVPPAGRMMGLRFVLPGGEEQRRGEVREFFSALARVTARSGSREVFGDAARGPHQLMEPLMRGSFRRHTRDELARLTAGVLPEHAPLDATFDGDTSMPVLIDVRDIFGEPGAVIEAVARKPAVPIRRGTNFLVAEVTEGGVRLHEARRRQVDGQFSCRATTTIDGQSVLGRMREPPAISRLFAERPELARENSLDLLFGGLMRGLATHSSGAAGNELALSIEALRSDTFTSVSPVITSD